MRMLLKNCGKYIEFVKVDSACQKTRINTYAKFIRVFDSVVIVQVGNKNIQAGSSLKINKV